MCANRSRDLSSYSIWILWHLHKLRWIYIIWTLPEAIGNLGSLLQPWQNAARDLSKSRNIRSHRMKSISKAYKVFGVLTNWILILNALLCDHPVKFGWNISIWLSFQHICIDLTTWSILKFDTQSMGPLGYPWNKHRSLHTSSFIWKWHRDKHELLRIIHSVNRIYSTQNDLDQL